MAQTPLSRFWSLEDALHTSHVEVDNRIQQVLRYGRIHSVEQIGKDLERTAKTVLDPFCEKWGRGAISSGYRSPRLNALVHGMPNSAHTVGLAFDWLTPCSFAAALEWARTQSPESLPFDRLIIEERGKTRWLHVQASEEGAVPARLVFHSPFAGVYTQMTPEQILALPV